MSNVTTSSSKSQSYKYWAFISYSHQDNLATRGDGTGDHIAWANWLHEHLETFRVPEGYRDHPAATGEPMPERFFPAFRDEAELPTSHDLGGQIHDALRRSRFLIVIASPRSAASRYVNEEVRYFRQLGRGDRILTLIVDGEPNVRLRPKSGWIADDDCFCPALVHSLKADGTVDDSQLLPEEPIAADVRVKDVEPPREMHQHERGRPDRRHLLDFMKLKLIAGLMNASLDELVQRDSRRRIQRLRRVAAASLLGLLIVTGLALYAFNQRDKAEASLQRANMLNEQAARSELFLSNETFRQGEQQEALLHLAQVIRLQQSYSAPEETLSFLKEFAFPIPNAICDHKEIVQDAVFSNDGSRVVTSCNDGTARVWDARTGRLIFALTGNEGGVSTAEFSPDDSRIVTAAAKTVRVWNATTGEMVAKLIGHDAPVKYAQFNSDGSRVFTASDDTMARLMVGLIGKEDELTNIARDSPARVWDVRTGKAILTLSGREGLVTNARFSQDGSRNCTLSLDGAAHIWDTTTGNLVATFHYGERFGTAEFSPDNSRIITIVQASEDNGPRVWDATTGKLVTVLKGHSDTVESAHFSADGSRIVTASKDKTARVWDAIDGRLIATLTGHTECVRSACFSLDAQCVLTASDDKTARLWDAGTGKLFATLSGHEKKVPNAHFNRDGSSIVSSSADGTARVWSASTGKALADYSRRSNTIHLAKFSPDGSRVVTVSSQAQPRVWDAATGKLITTLVGHEDEVWGADFSPNGRQVVTTSWDKTARVWRPDTGTLMAILRGHEKSVDNVAFSPDGARIVTASGDGTARVWEAATGQPISTLSGHKWWLASARYSPDGQLIVTASGDNSAIVWDAVTSKLLYKLSSDDHQVDDAFFNPDGSRIITLLRYDAGAQVWETATGKRVATFSGSDHEAKFARLNAKGTRLLTWSDNSDHNTVAIRDLATGKSIATVQGWSPHIAGERLVVHTTNDMLEILDTDGGRRIATFAEGKRGDFGDVYLSSDGLRVLTTPYYSDTATIWDTVTGKPVCVLHVDDAGWSARLRPFDPTIRSIREKIDAPDWFPEFLEWVAQARLSPDGKVERINHEEWLRMKAHLMEIKPRWEIKTDSDRWRPDSFNILRDYLGRL